MFAFRHDRDAFATIRGYVFQVEQTILRWLELPANGMLVLECGEDIDHVSRAFPGVTTEQLRILEQVKRREGKVSLRSVSETLARTFEQRRKNPGLPLRVRFTTNASATIETHSSLPNDVPGLLAWDALHRQGCTTPDDWQTLSSLREIVRSTSRPTGIDSALWLDFQAWVEGATADEWLTFVQVIEFSTSQPDVDPLRENIITQLADRGLSANLGRAIAIDGESASAVAADLGLAAGAIRQAKFRILRRLRRELDGWPFDKAD